MHKQALVKWRNGRLTSRFKTRNEAGGATETGKIPVFPDRLEAGATTGDDPAAASLHFALGRGLLVGGRALLAKILKNKD